jgi:exopolysaccharide production protein ExoZ
MSSASTKLDGVQTLRGVAAVVVALFHFSVLERAFYGPDFLLPGFSGYGRAGVDLFFVISGFIMVLVAGQTRSGAQSAWEFLVKRAVRIYPPYWVVTLAVIAIWWLSGGFQMAFLIGKNPNWIASLTLWPQDRYPILLVGWTLIHEMYFYLVFAALLFAPIAWRPRLLALWALIVLASTLFGVKPTSAVEKVVLSPLTLEFILGCAVALVRPRVKGLFWPAIAFAAIWVVVAVTLLGFSPTHKQFEEAWPRVLIFGPASALLVFAVTDPKRHIAWPKPLVRLGDASYAFYLLHVPLFSLLRPVWDRFSGPGIYDNAIALLVMMGASLALSFLFFRLIEQPTVRLGGRLARLRP